MPEAKNTHSQDASVSKGVKCQKQNTHSQDASVSKIESKTHTKIFIKKYFLFRIIVVYLIENFLE
jgi:hypothetical protein